MTMTYLHGCRYQNRIMEVNKMDDLISRKWLMECVNEGWIKFDTEKDKNTYVHLVRDIAPSAQETHEERTETHACDCISRQAAIDAVQSRGEVTVYANR